MRIEVPYCENYVLKIFARKLNVSRLFCFFVFLTSLNNSLLQVMFLIYIIKNFFPVPKLGYYILSNLPSRD